VTATYPSTRPDNGPPPPHPPPAPPGARPSRPRPVGMGGGLTNAALALLSVASVVSLGRLFTNQASFVAPVGFAVLAVHLACWLCRRKGLGLGLTALASAAILLVALGWTTLPQSTFFGLPLLGTLAAAGRSLSAALDRFHSASSPTAVVPGFVVAGAIGCATAAFLADWAAFRMRATVEACLPSFSLFVFSSTLARGHDAGLAVGVWLAALLTFLLIREAGVDAAPAAWFASRSDRGPAAVLQLGALLAMATVVVAVLVGPILPGATTKPLINWRRHSSTGAGRTTTSPLVDIKARISGPQSTTEVFTVKSAAPHYWRITPLSSFNGSGGWTISDPYVQKKGKLAAPAVAGIPTADITAKFSISNLDSLWLPAPFRPTRISVSANYNAGTASLVAKKPTSNGLTYTVQADISTPDTDTLKKSPPVTDPALKPDLDLPISPAVRTELQRYEQEATAGATTPYGKALNLQNWFRDNFTYSLDVPADDSTDAILRFLRPTGSPDSRTGFCQQFAGTFAVMARDMGLPARVAVGFTPGILESDGLYHVEDQHAHAWPEVYFTGIGWVAFEPTPSRGAPPSDEPWTGVAQSQGGPDPSRPETTTTAPPRTGPTTPAPTAKPRETVRSVGGAETTTKHHRHIGGIVWLLVLAALVVGSAITPVLTLRRRVRRRRRATTADARVLLAWDESREGLAAVGARPREAETPAEYADRAARGASLSDGEAHALRRLAGAVAETSYAATLVSDDLAAVAIADRDVVATAVAARQSAIQRVLGLFDHRRLRR
jgi:transglutaminase-like putative cysteine protease